MTKDVSILSHAIFIAIPDFDEDNDTNVMGRDVSNWQQEQANREVQDILRFQREQRLENNLLTTGFLKNEERSGLGNG